jgi:hypothetical protein
MRQFNSFSAFPEVIVDSYSVAMDSRLVEVIRKYENLSVMTGLDPAIHAASAPLASHSDLDNIIIALIA